MSQETLERQVVFRIGFDNPELQSANANYLYSVVIANVKREVEIIQQRVFEQLAPVIELANIVDIKPYGLKLNPPSLVARNILIDSPVSRERVDKKRIYDAKGFFYDETMPLITDEIKLQNYCERLARGTVKKRRF